MEFPFHLARMMGRIGALALVFTGIAASARGEEPLPDVKRLETSPVLRHLKPNPMKEPARTPAERTLAQMYLPEGFRAELIVAEPEVHQPIAFAIDARGRLWVAEAYSYPQRRPEGEGEDKIVIFEDRDGDGKFESRKVFAEGLNLVSGFEVGHGGVWVGAAPELLFIPDRDQDDRPDGPPEVLLDGFGYQDTHECLNSFMWGPDGWLYGNQGVFNYARIGKPGAPDSERTELRAGVWRYHPQRREFEIFAYGGSNQWGLDYDELGQIFMTHCRSYWGRGGTTHVIQGGHYWNQANANYAPFIIANPPQGFPEFRNYLLASARYDHGAGGAGKPGSDLIYGGHSHVGTMIYLGDNWPDEFRGHLFTHNLHGHQINHQVNRRLGSGFDTVHAGQDQFFCSDPKYVAVDLQYGPDGAVYTIDWYDQQHCHNPNTERWERGSGRIYRLQYDATYRPKKVDLIAMDDLALAKLHAHPNQWFVRTARRLLHERSSAGPIADAAKQHLLERFRESGEAADRLGALWTLHLIGELTDETARRGLKDPDEYVRGWTIQLLAEDRKVSEEFLREFVRMARNDVSPVVRLYLASVIQRIPEEPAWQVAEALAARSEDKEDRNIPLLLWHGMAQLMPGRVDRALEVAGSTPLGRLADSIAWYAATMEGEALEQAIRMLARLDGETRDRRLAGLALAMNERAGVPMPAVWREIAPKLYASEDVRVRRRAELVGGAFRDATILPRLRKALANREEERAERDHAFRILSHAQDAESLPIFIGLLDEEAFRPRALALLARFDAPEIAEALLERYANFSREEKSIALNTMAGRVSLALPLLKAIADGKVARADLTAFHVRQLSQLGHPEIDRQIVENWGRVSRSAGEKQAEIARMEKIFNEAPLWAYSASEGRKLYQTLCASCHVLKGEGTRIGPELTGAGRNGARYFLEAILDPNAVVGQDFQVTTITTRDGEVISGLLESETASAVAVRTVNDRVVVAKPDIAERRLSELSMMPEGLLDPLKEREKIELLKFLTEN